MLTLSEIQKEIALSCQGDLDRIRRSPDWSLGYAIGATPMTSPHYCPDLNVLTAICGALGERNHTLRDAMLRSWNWDAVVIGWLDAGRVIGEPRFASISEFYNDVIRNITPARGEKLG